MGTRERLGFALAGFGQNLVLNFVTLFLLVYLVEGVGLTSAGIAAVTLILTAAKVWDAVADLTIGVLIDRTRTRWGRFRPYPLVLAVPVGVLTVAIFSVPAGSEASQLLYFGIAYVVFATLYTLADVPYWALTSAMTTDDRSRTTTIAWARTAGTLGLALATLGGTPLARALGGGGATTAAGWSRAALVVAVLGMALFTLAFFATRERVAPAERPTPLRESVRLFVANRALFALLASGALGFGRFVLQVGGAVLALVVFGDETTFTLLGAALIVGMIVATLATPALLRRTTRRRLMIVSTLASAVAFTVQWLLGYGSLPVVVGVIFVGGLLLGVFMVTQTTMVGDAADHGEVVTGTRHDGVCYAGLTFVSKLCGALATVVFGTVLAGVGYTRGVTVTPAMKDAVWAAVTLVPAASCLLSLVPLRAYRVPEAELPSLLAEARLASRNATAA